MLGAGAWLPRKCDSLWPEGALMGVGEGVPLLVTEQNPASLSRRRGGGESDSEMNPKLKGERFYGVGVQSRRPRNTLNQTCLEKGEREKMPRGKKVQEERNGKEYYY